MLYTGVTEVRLSVDEDFETSPGLSAGMTLYALAGMLAPSHMPLRAQNSQCLNIGTVPALAITALAATLREAQITCCKFKVQHWATLFSLRSLRKAVLTLQHSEQAPGQQPLLITSQRMQLTNLQFLQFDSTRVDIAAPLLAHAAALISLKTLFFVDCSLGMLPAGVLNLPHCRPSACMGVSSVSYRRWRHSRDW